jgi:hypothetical protein
LHLTVTLDDAKVKEQPDLSALRNDFTLVGTQRVVNYTLINGQGHSLNQWIILLLPKHAGNITIPALSIGQNTTQALQVEVTGKEVIPQKEDGESAAVKFVTKISENSPYVNQQVIYTVKLYNRSRLLDAEYQPPKVKNALVVTLGGAKRYQVTENGAPYAVEELQYGFFPQKSGPLTITPPEFRALVFDSIPGKVQIKAKTRTLTVKPAKMLGDKTPWLPAKDVQLTETYDNQSDNLEQGGMIVRTVTLRAEGAAAQLLPKLTFASSKQFSVYPESPVEETKYQKSNLLGVVTVKVTYLLNHAGTAIIPELKLPWFNTDTDKPEVASLPARTLMVYEAAAERHVTTSTTAPVTPVTGTAPAMSADSTGAMRAPLHLAWKVALGFGLLWLLTLVLWWWSRQPQTKQSLARAKKSAKKSVQLACLHNDPRAAKDALLAWAKTLWPLVQFTHLGEVEKQVGDASLKRAIAQLSEYLYQGDSVKIASKWQGGVFWDCFASYRPEKVIPKKEKKMVLPPINP